MPYLDSDRAFFDHYLTYWGSPNAPFVHLSEKEVFFQRQRVLSSLPEIEQRFTDIGFSLDQIELILFVGQNKANGHAFLRDGKPVVWVAIEAYHSKLEADVFVTHELVHGLHYASRPEFAFSTPAEKAHVGRQVLTEGVATFLTQQILGCTLETALWADSLSTSDASFWMHSCQDERPRLEKYLFDHWLDDHGAALDLFYANDPKDIWRYRAGYYPGAVWMEAICRTRGLMMAELLAVSREDLTAWVKGAF